MNVSPAVALRLRVSGHEAIHWSQAGPSTANDPTISAYAAANRYVVVTHDLDFAALHAKANTRSPSVILIRADNLSVPDLTAKLEALIADLELELISGALVTIDLLRTRVRVHPIHQ